MATLRTGERISGEGLAKAMRRRFTWVAVLSNSIGALVVFVFVGFVVPVEVDPNEAAERLRLSAPLALLYLAVALPLGYARARPTPRPWITGWFRAGLPATPTAASPCDSPCGSRVSPRGSGESPPRCSGSCSCASRWSSPSPLVPACSSAGSRRAPSSICSASRSGGRSWPWPSPDVPPTVRSPRACGPDSRWRGRSRQECRCWESPR